MKPPTAIAVRTQGWEWVLYSLSGERVGGG